MSATPSIEGSAPTRHAILTAAARAFAVHGYRAATVQRIASDAGFTPPTLYAHFGNKQGLFEALVERLRADLSQVLERSQPEGLSLGHVLELRLRDLLELAERQRDVFMLFVVRPYDLPDLNFDSHDERLLTEYWEGVFARHEAELGDRTPHEGALVMEGLTYAWLKHWLASGEERVAHRAGRLVDLMLHGLLT